MTKLPSHCGDTKAGPGLGLGATLVLHCREPLSRRTRGCPGPGGTRSHAQTSKRYYLLVTLTPDTPPPNL
ncbi:hypothetical protein RRG08_025608 [Elysia crispata]|uniref:Uncharacterized protein n=1 Tax=Elysia crispata TaxID=231223 RepID=A0AAE0YE40_9GAST|nr:hypothetical protein RRG08_025608 [Elysia crispata]